ncbi:MAG: sigma-70 family RNA polymerase sigma factor [Planctomycetes bacterium]|nr:sigma-70 family RNA polymerase sigma factor [Planctomycetota bacterium]
MRKDSQRHARFLDLVEAHQGAIRKVAALYARDRADREDLFQEIVLQLWHSFETFRGESSFSSFLYRVALNTALLRVRQAERRPRIDARAALAEVESPTKTGHDDEVERLYAAIRALESLDRALVLLVLEELSHAEIAAVTGLTVGNVSVRLSRCKERLRRLLGATGSVPGGTACSTKR